MADKYFKHTLSTRKYAFAGVQRVAVAAAEADSAAIDALEVMLHASVKCHVRAGPSPQAATASNGIPLEAGEKFHLQINEGDIVSVIRDSADGFLHIVPVDGAK